MYTCGFECQLLYPMMPYGSVAKPVTKLVVHAVVYRLQPAGTLHVHVQCIGNRLLVEESVFV